MTICVHTLTPLWTGGVQGVTEAVHATGLLGSLRWWYEVIVRGLGGKACDPTDRDRCGSEPRCAACRIFGSTGARRPFSISVTGNVQAAWERDLDLNIRPHGRTRGWYLKAGLLGEVRLHLRGDTDTLMTVVGLIRAVERIGNLGARPQVGYGAFRVEDGSLPAPGLPWKVLGENPPGILPDLRTMLGWRLSLVPRQNAWWSAVAGFPPLRGRRGGHILQDLAGRGMVPTAPALRNFLRYETEWTSPAVPNWLFGSLSPRHRSRFFAGWAVHAGDRWVIRCSASLTRDEAGRRSEDEMRRVLRQQLARPESWLVPLGMQPADVTSAKVSAVPWIGSPGPASPHEVCAFLNGESEND